MADLARWLTEHQAAEHVNRSPRTLRMWRQHNEVRSHKQGKSLTLYYRESLEQCAAQQQVRYRLGVGRPPA